jgi:hypothetical protein
MAMIHTALYARVSSTRQKQKETIASQVAALREHATGQGWEIPDEWVFIDDGWSGATLVRPGLERLRDLSAQRIIEQVLCLSPDRLARNYAHQVLLVEEFTRCGPADDLGELRQQLGCVVKPAEHRRHQVLPQRLQVGRDRHQLAEFGDLRLLGLGAVFRRFRDRV